MKKSTKAKLIAGAAAFTLSVAALYDKIKVTRYTLFTGRIKDGIKIRIVLISDLHSYIYKGEQDEIIEMIKGEKPDIIALAGDMVDDIKPIKGAKLFFEKIKDIAPAYYVSGNHEYKSGGIDDIKSMISLYGVKVLEHSYEQIEINGQKLVIAGVDDPIKGKYHTLGFDWEKETGERFKELKDMAGYKILITHRPEMTEVYENSPFDLVLSGHAHGGLVRIPFIMENGLFASNQGFFPKITGGLHMHKNVAHIVSRGAAHNFYQPRVFNRAEVVSIRLEGKKLK